MEKIENKKPVKLGAKFFPKKKKARAQQKKARAQQARCAEQEDASIQAGETATVASS